MGFLQQKSDAVAIFRVVEVGVHERDRGVEAAVDAHALFLQPARALHPAAWGRALQGEPGPADGVLRDDAQLGVVGHFDDVEGRHLDGHHSRFLHIVEVLAALPPRARLLHKRFNDSP